VHTPEALRTMRCVVLIACASHLAALRPAVLSHHATARRSAHPVMLDVDTPPPDGFVWATFEDDAATTTAAPSAVTPAADAKAAAPPKEGEPQRRAAYFCNDQGCWVGEAYFCDETGCWVEDSPAPVTLPDGRAFTGESGVESYAKSDSRKKPPAPKKPAPQGIFAPAVLGAKAVLGQKELNALRAKVIAEHTKVISAFVDTSDSAFGQIVLKRMFEAADKDGNGTLDKEEVAAALRALGFSHLQEKQIDGILSRADADENEVIDFEEFVREAPKTLRTNLVKLAKQNGAELGFLA
jgi:hypothetical protein